MLQQQAMKNLKNRQRAAKVGVLFQDAENQLFFTAPSLTDRIWFETAKCPADEITQRTNAALQCCQLADTANSHRWICIVRSDGWSPSPAGSTLSATIAAGRAESGF